MITLHIEILHFTLINSTNLDASEEHVTCTHSVYGTFLFYVNIL